MVDALAAQATEAKKTMDDGLKEGTKLGPINNKMQFARVRQPIRILLYMLTQTRSSPFHGVR